MSDDETVAVPEQIAPDDLLWRRLHPKHVVPDTLSGGDRISSAAFTDPELSVDLARLVEGNDFHVTMKDGAGVAEFSASAALDKKLPVEHAPLPDNYAHTHVLGKKTESIQRHLTRSSDLLR
ncbi:MAG: hypothetical protein HYX34_03985 [Actinobacteria bacterium]|nr:hypothetical protein [Actinomycetota bacterium]